MILLTPEYDDLPQVRVVRSPGYGAPASIGGGLSASGSQAQAGAASQTLSSGGIGGGGYGGGGYGEGGYGGGGLGGGIGAAGRSLIKLLYIIKEINQATERSIWERSIS